MKLKYLGVPVFMNGQNYYIPSLAYQDFKQNYQLLTGGADQNDQGALLKWFDSLIPVIGLAVRRNYPDISDEDLGGWLDMTTLPLMIKAVQNASGMTAVSESPEGE